MGKLGNEQQRLPLNLKQTTPVVCEKCGCRTFNQAMMIQEVPAILTGTGQPGLVPVTVFTCTKCGHVNDQFIPEELKNNVSKS